MKYAENSAIGDAGEYLFAYCVTTILEWPCRLLDIDIGIDAQIEILDEERNSTGQFLAVQIKSTTDENKRVLSLKKEHVKYWKSIEIPVLVALVNIRNNEIYLKHVNKSKINQEFKFNSNEDLLTARIKHQLRVLAYSEDISFIKNSVLKITSQCELILRDIDKEEVHKIADVNYYLGFIDEFKSMELMLHETRFTVAKVKKIIGDCDYTSTLKFYMDTRDRFKNFLYEWDLHIEYDETVRRFESEHIESNSYLNI